MKKIQYIFALLVMCLFTLQIQAQPLFVNNNSDSSPQPYKITTYLIYSRVGEVCSGRDWALPFTFAPGASLAINDGSFLWTSPWNGIQTCLSTPIGYGCDPIALDFYGQRIENMYYDNLSLTGMAGVISTIAGTPCLGPQLNIGSSDPGWQPPMLSGDYTVTLPYNGSVSFSSTINYLNWGIMQTLVFN